jgi:hypothetical protein
MVELSSRIAMVLALPLLCACGADGRPMLLDQVCRGSSLNGSGTPNCTLGGDAEYVSGITADSRAVRLGPSGQGSLSILISALGAASQPNWSVEVLVAAGRPEGSILYRSMTWGSCPQSCPADLGDVEAALDQDFQWARVITDAKGQTTSTPMPGFPPTVAAIPDDAVITLRGADIDIVDLRTPGFEGFDPDTLQPR